MGPALDRIALEVSRLVKWMPDVKRACEFSKENRYLLSAVCLRESGAGYATGYLPTGSASGYGDHGHGFGLFQIDNRYHADFINGATSNDPYYQCLKACSILATARVAITKRISLPPDDLEYATVAAYNAGVNAVVHQLAAGQHPDMATTGKDYSQWVMRKASELILYDAKQAVGPGLA